MADALCGPSNALQSFQKHSSVDRTLQQDRIAARQSHEQGFRSSPGPNVGVLDAEFDAFQASHPLEAGYSDYLFHHNNPTNSFQQHAAQPGLPNWASDFQNLHINDARASPIPTSQFHQHAPMHRTAPGGWHQDFLRQQHRSDAHQQQKPQMRQSGFQQPYVPQLAGSQIAPTHAFMPQEANIQSETEQYKEAVGDLDDSLFDRAFEQVALDITELDKAASAEDVGTIAWDDHTRIGSDLIVDQAQKKEEQRNDNADEADELARTAGNLLEKVQGDTSQKFQESQFLGLMRQLRDREVRVEGDKLVDVSQPLHPGGEFYPNGNTTEVEPSQQTPSPWNSKTSEASTQPSSAPWSDNAETSSQQFLGPWNF